MSKKILEIKNLTAGYKGKRIVDHVSFDLYEGEVLGIVGESGCGKSTLLKTLLNPAEYGISVEKGEAVFQGKDLLKLTEKERRQLYGSQITMVFQNSASSFNPIRTYRKQFEETLKSHNLWKGEASVREILDSFSRIHLSDGERILDSCPYELSGGMNQRVGITMATILQPAFLLADEPTSALDVTVQAEVVKELMELHQRMQFSMILVTHNMGVAVNMCDKIAVMHNGVFVELKKTAELLKNPEDEYSRRLFQAVPRLKNGRRKQKDEK